MLWNPNDAMADVRRAVEQLLTLGEPAISIVGFDGISAPYPCCSTSTSNGVLGVEWETFEQLTDAGSCGTVWKLSAKVLMRRCWPSFSKVAGIADGNPPPPYEVQARASAFTAEAWSVATGLVQWAELAGAEFEINEVWPFGPEGNCAGWDLKFSLNIYTCEKDQF